MAGDAPGYSVESGEGPAAGAVHILDVGLGKISELCVLRAHLWSTGKIDLIPVKMIQIYGCTDGNFRAAW
jgi:hypothetical protein